MDIHKWFCLPPSLVFMVGTKFYPMPIYAESSWWNTLLDTQIYKSYFKSSWSTITSFQFNVWSDLFVIKENNNNNNFFPILPPCFSIKFFIFCHLVFPLDFSNFQILPPNLFIQFFKFANSPPVVYIQIFQFCHLVFPLNFSNFLNLPLDFFIKFFKFSVSPSVVLIQIFQFCHFFSIELFKFSDFATIFFH